MLPTQTDMTRHVLDCLHIRERFSIGPHVDDEAYCKAVARAPLPE